MSKNLIFEAVCSSKSSFGFHRAKWCYIPEDRTILKNKKEHWELRQTKQPNMILSPSGIYIYTNIYEKLLWKNQSWYFDGFACFETPWIWSGAAWNAVSACFCVHVHPISTLKCLLHYSCSVSKSLFIISWWLFLLWKYGPFRWALKEAVIIFIKC
jgi:hypothetical protein